MLYRDFWVDLVKLLHPRIPTVRWGGEEGFSGADRNWKGWGSGVEGRRWGTVLGVG